MIPSWPRGFFWVMLVFICMVCVFCVMWGLNLFYKYFVYCLGVMVSLCLLWNLWVVSFLFLMGFLFCLFLFFCHLMSSVLLLALAHLMFLVLIVFSPWFSIFCILKFEFLKFGFWLLLVLWDSSFCLLHWVLGFYQGHMVSHFLVSICYNGLVCLSFVSNHFKKKIFLIFILLVVIWRDVSLGMESRELGTWCVKFWFKCFLCFYVLLLCYMRDLSKGDGIWNLKRAKGVQLCPLKVDIDKMSHIFYSLDC